MEELKVHKGFTDPKSGNLRILIMHKKSYLCNLKSGENVNHITTPFFSFFQIINPVTRRGRKKEAHKCFFPQPT